MNRYFKQLEVHNTNIFILSIICIRIIGMLSISILAEITYIPTSVGLAVTQIIFLLVPSVLYILFNKKSLPSVGLTYRFNFAALFVVLLISIFVQPVMTFLSAVSSLIFPNEITRTVSAMDTGGIFTFVIVAFLPAICEEFVMRGVFLNGYINGGVKVATAALINGLFFGILHMDLQQFMYAFVAGIVFSYIVIYTRSVIYTMLAHFVINSTQLILYRMLLSAAVPENASEAASVADSFSVLSGAAAVCVPVLLLLFYILKKVSSPKPVESEGELTFIIEDRTDYEENPKIVDFPFGITLLIYLLFIMLIYFM